MTIYLLSWEATSFFKGEILHQTFILWIVKALFLKHEFVVQRRIHVYGLKIFLRLIFVYFITSDLVASNRVV